MRSWGLPIDELLLLMIAAFLFFKALVFRRETSLGRKLAVSNLILSATYLGAVVGRYLTFFRTDFWLFPMRFLLFLTTMAVAVEVMEVLGGPAGVRREVRAAWREFWDYAFLATSGLAPTHPSGDGEALRGAAESLLAVLVWALLVLVVLASRGVVG